MYKLGDYIAVFYFTADPWNWKSRRHKVDIERIKGPNQPIPGPVAPVRQHEGAHVLPRRTFRGRATEG